MKQQNKINLRNHALNDQNKEPHSVSASGSNELLCDSWNTSLTKLQEIEEFFKDAFCADSAKLIKHKEENISITGVIKIKTSDSRGTFLIAMVEEKNT